MAEKYDHALPELRWVKGPFNTAAMRPDNKLQQRWRTVEEVKAPTHEWRDVPEVKEES
jgi:hypothetical protein